jgi:hypothetical protein
VQGVITVLTTQPVQGTVYRSPKEVNYRVSFSSCAVVLEVEW